MCASAGAPRQVRLVMCIVRLRRELEFRSPSCSILTNLILKRSRTEETSFWLSHLHWSYSFFPLKPICGNFLLVDGRHGRRFVASSFPGTCLDLTNRYFVDQPDGGYTRHRRTVFAPPKNSAVCCALFLFHDKRNYWISTLPFPYLLCKHEVLTC